MKKHKHYVIKIDEHTIRIFQSASPPEGAVELEREPDQDETLRIEGGKCVYKKIPKAPKKPSMEKRITALEQALYEAQK